MKVVLSADNMPEVRVIRGYSESLPQNTLIITTRPYFTPRDAIHVAIICLAKELKEDDSGIDILSQAEGEYLPKKRLCRINEKDVARGLRTKRLLRKYGRKLLEEASGSTFAEIPDAEMAQLLYERLKDQDFFDGEITTDPYQFVLEVENAVTDLVDLFRQRLQV
jgi:hypothetical protein